MRQLTRRSLIGHALAAGAGGSVLLGLEARSSRAAVRLEPDPATGYDPGFLMGTVVQNGGSGIYEVADSAGNIQTISIARPSLVWKEGLQGGPAIAVGDAISARGVRAANAVLQVAGAWVDIQSMKATVMKSSATQLQVQVAQFPGRSMPVAILPISEIDAPPQGAFVQGNASQVGENDIVQLIGFGDLTAGSFTATRVFVLKSASYPAIANGPDDAASGSTYFGIASYFDCSGNGACQGCITCESGYNQMAWPRMIHCGGSGTCISDCGGNTCSASCCSGLPDVECGSGVRIYGRCTNKGVTVRVADCGPCVYCKSSFGCQGYKTVKFDLTRSAFSAIAPLSYGLTDVQATP